MNLEWTLASLSMLARSATLITSPCRAVLCLLSTKANPATPWRLRRRGRELPNSFDQLPDGLVVGADVLFQFSEFAGQFLVSGDELRLRNQDGSPHIVPKLGGGG